jgi:hypothetical protein
MADPSQGTKYGTISTSLASETSSEPELLRRPVRIRVTIQIVASSRQTAPNAAVWKPGAVLNVTSICSVGIVTRISIRLCKKLHQRDELRDKAAVLTADP